MKIRSDFVTNSSSSSFIVVDIESETLANIMRHLEKEVKQSFLSISVSKNSVHLTGDDIYCESIEDVSEIVERLINIFSDSVSDIVDSEQPETIKVKSSDEADIVIAKTIYNRRKEIEEDIKTVNWQSSDVGWGGDDDTRFCEESYDEEDLDELYKEIMEAKGYTSKEQVTEEDFGDFVSDGVSESSHYFTYNKENNISEHSYSYDVEFY